jgi:lipopolysaccharide/colanic/teichoic acid biosynthesis glycosyltransferase/NDP-sugar pyrophosphorylase family protein
MKAVILAGSPGTALFPLANCHPLLAFPVGNRPLLAHQFDVLRRAGITQVTLIANGHADEYRRLVQKVAQRERPDLHVQVVTEAVPAGTAGALRAIEAFAAGDGVVLVTGGVHFAALDLTRLIEAHRARRAALTVVTQSDDSVPYIEHVDVDEQQTVRAIHLMHHSRDRRRPGSPRRVPDRRSPRITAGVYVIDPAAFVHVQRAGYMDLKEQLVPALRSAGLVVYAHHRSGATRIVSSLTQYLDLNAAFLEGARDRRVAVAERELACNVWAGSNVRIAATARLRGPIVIGANSVIGPGSTITGPAAIGSNCAIEADASIERSVIWSGSRIGPNATISRAVVTERCDVTASSVVSNGAVVPGSTGINRLARIAGKDATGDRFNVWIADGRVVPLHRASLRHRISTLSKRAIDVVLSLAALVVLAPVVALIAAAITLDSRGPVFFSQRRCGKHGREFRMWKFRTMVPDADRQQAALFARKDVDGPMFKLEHDPRVTGVGRVLRKTSLDELPQLLNVLRGEMSLVGPRPLVMEEMKFAPAWRDMRLQVRPGISGLWQVNGRSNVSFHDWIHHDIRYVTQRSLMLDAIILMRTLRALRVREGAK